MPSDVANKWLETIRALNAALDENEKSPAGAADEVEAMAAMTVAFVDLVQARWVRLRARLDRGGVSGFEVMHQATTLAEGIKQGILAAQSCSKYCREARQSTPAALDGAAARASAMLSEAQALLGFLQRANAPPAGVDLDQLADKARAARARGETVEARPAPEGGLRGGQHP
jgi:hypothetical protein